jgi:hypothetical protein
MEVGGQFHTPTTLSPVPIEQEARKALKPVWTMWSRKQCLCPLRKLNPGCPVRSPSLCRLKSICEYSLQIVTPYMCEKHYDTDYSALSLFSFCHPSFSDPSVKADDLSVLNLLLYDSVRFSILSMEGPFKLETQATAAIDDAC